MKGLRTLAVLALMVCALPAVGALNAYLKIDGFKSGSTSPGHEGWIELMSFSWAVSNQRPTAGGVVTGCAGDQGKFTVKVVGISQTNFTPDPLDLQIPLWIGSHKELPSVTVDINGQRHVLQNVTFTSYESAGKDTRSGVFTFAR